MKLLFFGSDAFSLHSLQRLAQKYPRIQLVSNSSLLIRYARTNGIPAHIPPPKTLKHWTPPTTSSDLAVVVSFGYFLPAALCDSFPLGAINVHPSLLPKYRGPAPIAHSLLNNDTETGISVIELDRARFDAGRILSQTRVSFAKDIFYSELHDMLAKRGADELEDCIDRLSELKNALVQDEALVTRAPKIQTKLAEIDFDSMSADRIFTLHRAIGEKIPLYTNFRGKRVQLLNLTPSLESDCLAPPGTITFSKHENRISVVCAKGSSIDIQKLQVQDKPKPVDPINFNNGYLLKIDDVFCVQR